MGLNLLDKQVSTLFLLTLMSTVKKSFPKVSASLAYKSCLRASVTCFPAAEEINSCNLFTSQMDHKFICQVAKKNKVIEHHLLRKQLTWRDFYSVEKV